MVIIKFDCKEKIDEVLFEGELIDSIMMYDKITEDFESEGNFMVNEINIGGDFSTTFVREFATCDGGHVFDLIICGFIAKLVSIEGS